MATKVKDLTVGELQSLISDTIKSAMEDVLEDIVALSSERVSSLYRRGQNRL